MAGVTATAEIDRSAQDVFAYATDPTRFHEWQAGVVDGRLDQPEAPQVGTLCYTTRRIGLADRASTSEVTHIDPPQSWGVRGLDGPIRAIVDLTVTPLGATRSRLSITVDFEGHGIGKVLVPLAVRPGARKEMPDNLAALKRHLEKSWPRAAAGARLDPCGRAQTGAAAVGEVPASASSPPTRTPGWSPRSGRPCRERPGDAAAPTTPPT